MLGIKPLLGEPFGDYLGDQWYPPAPQINGPTPLPGRKPITNPSPIAPLPRKRIPGPIDDRCFEQWDIDLARCRNITKEMGKRGANKQEIAIWQFACQKRAESRKTRCENNESIERLPPYTAPWEPRQEP